MRNTINGNYLWLVLVVFLILPVVNAFTGKDAPVRPFQTAVEQAIDLPGKRQ